MRVVAIILVVVTLLAGGFFAYVYYGAHMEILGVTASVTAAADALPTYDDIRAQLANGTFLGKQYSEVEFLMPESFEFLTLTVRMSNKGAFPMDWIQIEVEPDPADVLQLYESRTPSLAQNTRADFSATLLTRRGASTSRTFTVHYYFLGYKLSVTHRMGGE